jgi:hypothetical protein
MNCGINEIGKNLNVLNAHLSSIFFEEEMRSRKLRSEIKKTKNILEVFSKISGIKNEAILEKLLTLGVQPDSIISLSLVPLILVAWADGEIQKKERKLIIKFAETAGFVRKGINREVLEKWLFHKPNDILFEAWKNYVKGLMECLSTEERIHLQHEIMSHAKAVAQAHGGFLGLNIISEAEKETLDKLENVLK